MSSYLYSPVISVTVGQFDPRTFHIHQQLLENNSHYFRAAARVWSSDTATRTMIYNNIEPMVFEVFARYVYNNEDIGRRDVYSLLPAYLLGVRIMADSFKECVANAIKNQLRGNRTLSVTDTMDLVRVVYANTSRGDTLRQVLVDHHQFVQSYTWNDQDANSVNKGTEGNSPVQFYLQYSPAMPLHVLLTPVWERASTQVRPAGMPGGQIYRPSSLQPPSAFTPYSSVYSPLGSDDSPWSVWTPVSGQMPHDLRYLPSSLPPESVRIPNAPWLPHANLQTSLLNSSFVPESPQYSSESPFSVPDSPEYSPASPSLRSRDTSPPYSPASTQLPTANSTSAPVLQASFPPSLSTRSNFAAATPSSNYVAESPQYSPASPAYSPAPIPQPSTSAPSGSTPIAATPILGHGGPTPYGPPAPRYAVADPSPQPPTSAPPNPTPVSAAPVLGHLGAMPYVLPAPIAAEELLELRGAVRLFV